MRSPLPALLAALTLGLGASPVASGGEHATPDEATLHAMTARFAPVDLGADVSGIPANERKALAKIIEAARIMDTLLLRQAWAGNDASDMAWMELDASIEPTIGPYETYEDLWFGYRATFE